MNQKFLIVMVLLLLLTGCGRKLTSELESFEGVTVATLQTPFSLIGEASMTGTAVSLPGSGETPLPTSIEPTNTPGNMPGMTAAPSQTSVNPYQFESTDPTPFTTASGANLTPTATLEKPDWAGTWNIWYQNSTGAYSSSVMTVQITDTQLSAKAIINSNNYTFEGEISMQGDEVEGKWKTSQGAGSFWWQMTSSNTFVGSREARFGFCGDKVSSDRPGSCRKLPSN